MTRKKLSCLPGLILSVTVLTPQLLAAQCTIDSDFMDRGERKAFIICGKGIPRNYNLKGLSEANLTVEYEQYLEMCGIGIDSPGIHLVLKAESDAQAASMSILSADTEEPVCEELRLAIPDRIHIAEVSLEDPTGESRSLKVLTMKARKPHDLSQACEEGLFFPEGKWPSLSLLSGEDWGEVPPEMKASFPANRPISCTESSVRALVKVRGQQRYSTKIIISKVKLEGGEEKEGVTYATLPPPAWGSCMGDEDAKYVNC